MGGKKAYLLCFSTVWCKDNEGFWFRLRDAGAYLSACGSQGG